MDYIETPHLDLNMHLQDEKDRIAAARREKWASQIEDTLRQLHEIDVVWGDIKTSNILVDKDDDAWLIDFGGGQTVGWVADDLAGTKEGDLQGLKRVMDNLGMVE